MEKKTISILGCGWLGQQLAQSLRDSNYTVYGSTTSPGFCRPLEELGIKPHLLNLHQVDLLTLQRFLDCDYLIYNIPPSKTSAGGLATLMELTRLTKVKAIIGISSTGIYHDSHSTITESNGASFIDKDSRLHTVESILLSGSIPVTILRLGGLVGGDRQPGKFAKSEAVLNNPNGRINFVHKDDVIEIVKRVIAREKWNEIFHCCSDEHPTKKEFYSLAAPAVGLPEPLFADVTNDPFKIIDNTKVKETLNFKFRSLDEFYLKNLKS